MVKKFRLAALLSYRERRLSLARMDLAVAERRLSDQEERVANIEDAVQTLVTLTTASPQAPEVDADRLRGSRAYLSGLIEALRDARRSAAGMGQQVETERRRVVGHQQDKKILERLRTKDWMREMEAEHKRESKINDEVAVSRAATRDWSDR